MKNDTSPKKSMGQLAERFRRGLRIGSLEEDNLEIIDKAELWKKRGLKVDPLGVDKLGIIDKAELWKKRGLKVDPLEVDKTKDIDSMRTYGSIKDNVISVDIVLITSMVSPEMQAVNEVFKLHNESTILFDGATFTYGTIQSGEKNTLDVVTSVQNDQGMVASALLTYKSITRFKPKIVIMTGICAGRKQETKLGDVIIAKEVIYYCSGKQYQDRFEPDYDAVKMPEYLIGCINDLLKNKASITSEVEQNNGIPRSNNEPMNIHFGTIACGHSVIADENVIKEISRHKRKVLGLEMESYGVAKAANSTLNQVPFLIVKGVADYADDAKNDKYHLVASTSSALLAFKFVTNYWSIFVKHKYDIDNIVLSK